MSLTAVTTRSGALSGLDMGSYAVFKGVPYAAPPVGPLRWKRPQPCQPWEGVRPATEFGPGCPQTPHDPDSFYYKARPSAPRGLSWCLSTTGWGSLAS